MDYRESRWLSIDRTEPFSPAEFFGKGWSIGEQDERSLALTEIDPASICLETMLGENEDSINGEDRLAYLKKASYIRLDAKIFQTFWQNQILIPEQWKKRTNGKITFIFFEGTELWGPAGHRYIPCLYWSGLRWGRTYRWLGGDLNPINPSAVLLDN